MIVACATERQAFLGVAVARGRVPVHGRDVGAATRPPLHTLPHGDLLATLRSLTNFRAVHDPAAPNGWRIEIGPFPGWRHVPTW